MFVIQITNLNTEPHNNEEITENNLSYSYIDFQFIVSKIAMVNKTLVTRHTVNQ